MTSEVQKVVTNFEEDHIILAFLKKRSGIVYPINNLLQKFENGCRDPSSVQTLEHFFSQIHDH